MKTRYKILIGVIALIVAFAFGKYSAHPGTKTVDVVHYKTKIQTHTVTVVVTKPNGTHQSTTTTDQTQYADTHSKSDVTVIKATNSSIKISALAGIDFSQRKIAYGAEVSKQILGPISVGAWGLTDGVIGVSIGISF